MRTHSVGPAHQRLLMSASGSKTPTTTPSPKDTTLKKRESPLLPRKTSFEVTGDVRSFSGEFKSNGGEDDHSSNGGRRRSKFKMAVSRIQTKLQTKEPTKDAPGCILIEETKSVPELEHPREEEVDAIEREWFADSKFRAAPANRKTTNLD